MFFDGGSTWRVQFASTQAGGAWDWATHADQPDYTFTRPAATLPAGPPNRTTRIQP
jgi:hypothetical protein